MYTIVKLADNYKDTLMDTDEVNLTQRYFGKQNLCLFWMIESIGQNVKSYIHSMYIVQLLLIIILLLLLWLLLYKSN